MSDDHPMPRDRRLHRVHRSLLALAVACASCGGAQTSAPSGPAFAREGASSGAMSRVGSSDETLVPIPPPPAYATPEATPPPTRANVTSNLGGDEVRAGSVSTPTPIALGQTIQGRLQQGDTPLADGSVADDYVFVAPAGLSIHVELHGGEVAGQPGSHMDMYLHLLHEGAEITHDDDGGGNLDSLIETTLPQSAAYVLRVTTFGSGLRPGAYTLILRQQ